MDRPMGRRVRKFDGPSGRGLWIARRAMLMKSALRDYRYGSYSLDTHSADWLAALASPYPAAPDFPRSSVGQSKGRPFYGQAKGLL